MTHLFAETRQEIYPIQLDVADPIAFSSHESSLMDRLENEFVGKCFRSLLVTSIDTILQRGLLLVSCSDPTLYYIQVLIRVTGISIMPGAIIPNCRIIEKQAPRTVMCRSDNPPANMIIMDGSLYEGLAVGSVIPVRVISPSYTQGSRFISLIARLFVHSPQRRTYPMSLTGMDSNHPAIVDSLAKLGAEEARCLPHRNAKNWAYFLRLFTPPLGTLPAGGLAATTDSPLLLDSYIRNGAMNGGLVPPVGNCIVPVCDGSQVLVPADSADPRNLFEAALTPIQGVCAAMAEMESYLRLVRNACETYTTKEMLLSHTVLWNLITASRA